jgi:hypothetical protein
MLLGSTLPLVVAGVTAMVAWRRETRRLDRRTLYEPWDADTSAEDFRRGLIDRRKRHRWSVTILSALAGSVTALVLLHFVHAAGMTHGG